MDREGTDLAPPVRFFSVAPEVVMEGLWNLVTFPKIYLRIFWNKNVLVTMDCVAMATKLSKGSQDKKKVYIFVNKNAVKIIGSFIICL